MSYTRMTPPKERLTFAEFLKKYALPEDHVIGIDDNYENERDNGTFCVVRKLNGRIPQFIYDEFKDRRVTCVYIDSDEDSEIRITVSLW